MLSPNVVDVSETMAGAFAQYTAVQAFGDSAMRTVISPLSPDPEWLSPLRNRMEQLKLTCQDWQTASPDILVDFLSPFVSFAPLVSSVAQTAQRKGVTSVELVQLLTALQRQMAKYRAVTKSAERRFAAHIQNIALAQKDLDQSLQVGWAELAREQKAMVAIASAITRLQDRLDQLQDDLTSAEISSGKSYFQTAATISYTLVTTAGAEIPFLSIAAEIYTIGKMAYDLIVTDQEIDAAIDQISKLRIAASEAAQAAAMARGVIQTITSFDKRMAALSIHLPALDQMWQTEADKVQATINALQSRADPATLFDVLTLPAAAASWRELANMAQLCINFPIRSGKSVKISTH